jgi:hypothetical protein
MRRRRRDAYTRHVVRIPEEALDERVLDLAAPLLERLGADPEPEAVRSAIELAITFWNAKARASTFWGDPRPKALDDLTRKMTGKKASARDAEAFELLSARWHEKEIAFDPRLVGDWSLEVGDDGAPRLSCEMELPDGVEAHVPPPIEKRVAIGGKFLDETQIRMTATTYLSFPVEAHRGVVGDDGKVTVRTRMPTAVALFGQGVLPPVGGGAVGLMVQGTKLDAMVLSEIACDANGGHNDIAVLIFRPASPSVTP